MSKNLKRHAPRLLRVWLPLGLLLGICLFGAEAWARPGGGGSFSSSHSSSSSSSSRSSVSSSRSSSSSSSGSSGPTSPWVTGIVLVFVGGICVFGVWAMIDSARSTPTEEATPAPTWTRKRLRRLIERDPAFSPVLFDDFLVALYTQVTQARGDGTLSRYAPYLSDSAQWSLARAFDGKVTAVLVGTARIENVSSFDAGEAQVRVSVNFESNVEIDTAQGQQGLYLRETWTLCRRTDAVSRSPEHVQRLGCPACGASLEVVVMGRCSHCNKDVVAGHFDWMVEQTVEQAREQRGPLLAGTTPERGTDFPSIVDSDAAARFQALCAADPALNMQALVTRTMEIFARFQHAWTHRHLEPMRQYLTDCMFSVQTYWVNEYKRQHLLNLTSNARILRVELARAESDAHYDAVTLRLWGTGLDYTVSDVSREVVGGSVTAERKYSEYWTLVRGRTPSASARASKVCPACVAPQSFEMSTFCGHCGSALRSHSFDWLLSRIEQDDVYSG